MKKFFIYKSSAGSGKTYTLVKEYLKLVLNNTENYKHTLAVTFTNKAAEEMKTRIINSLVELSLGRNDKLKKQLIAEGVKSDIKLTAKEVLKKILHNYSFFSVSTIDSFFHKIIRAFARELNLQLGYNIELDHSIVMDKIVNDLLSEIGENKELTKYLEDSVYYSINDNRGWKIEPKIKDIAAEIFKERYWIKRGSVSLANARNSIHKLMNSLYEIVNSFEYMMDIHSNTIDTMLKGYNLTPDDFPYVRGSFMNNFFEKIKTTEYDFSPRVHDACNDISKWSNRNSKPEVLKAAKDGLHDALVRALDTHKEHFRNYTTAKELLKTVYIIGIFDDLLDKLSTYRDENRLMLISDTNNLLMSVIEGNNSPFIYEKIGNLYKNYLIDEFQDTSTYQWRNFKPLIENSLSENNFSMIVGDVKQSIYRWRNGNMKLLLEDVRKDLGEFDELINEEPLKDNFRSGVEIIKFNNLFFKKAAEKIANRISGSERELILNSYTDVQQNEKSAKPGGYVNISFIDSIDEQDYKAREVAAEKTIEFVHDALSSGYSQKDIMVLARRNSEVREAAHYLTDAGFRVVSNDSLLLINSPRVKLLINILKYIVDSNNFLAKTEILYNFLVCIKNEDYNLNEIFNDYRKSENSIFDKTMPSEFFSENKISNILFSYTLYDLTENLVRIFKLNSTTDTYLLSFLDIVREYSKENNTDLSGFITWWDENKDKQSIVVPQDEDAIKIMTIHTAKGLQSPVVIIPYTNWELDMHGARDTIWASSEEEPFNEAPAFIVRAVKKLKNSHFEDDFIAESALTNLDNFNLLYVAFTRAAQRLYIISPQVGWAKYDLGSIQNSLNKGTAINSGQLIKLVLSEIDFMVNINAANLEFGEKSEYKSEKKNDINYFITNNIVSSNFYENIVVKPSSEGFNLQRQKKFAQSKNRGIILHKALSYIKSSGEIEQAIARLETEGIITKDNEDELLNELVEILKIKDVYSWFTSDYEVKSEAELILPGGEVYRPDRVLIKDNKAIVIDYKTGKEKEEYKEQINKYAGGLSEMGYTEIEKFIFYITQRKIVKI